MKGSTAVYEIRSVVAEHGQFVNAGAVIDVREVVDIDVDEPGNVAFSAAQMKLQSS